MIFVTVGTHEQQFNRLVEAMDQWAASHEEEVVIQTGFSTYEPKTAAWSKLYPYKTMTDMVERARIVITHGGPSSFIMPLQIGKIPIVVPRDHAYNEHVNNHQIDFCRKVVEQQGNILLVEKVEDLGDVIDHYERTIEGMEVGATGNNERFVAEFSKIADALVK